MTQKFNDRIELSPEQLAKHLRQPVGDIGEQVGLLMNKSNKIFCLNSYHQLAPTANSSILEIGPGNGFFVPDLLAMADNLNYTGVDYSPTMVYEAMRINAHLIQEGVVRFMEASIEKLPFSDAQFDFITTTNTLYFWPNPALNIVELRRVLKPGGKLLVAYRSKGFMDQIEFVKFGFNTFDSENVEQLMETAGFNFIHTEMIAEPELEFDGKPFAMEGHFTIGIK